MKDYQKEIDKKAARRAELFKEKEIIDAELSKLYKEITVLKDKQTKAKMAQEMTFEDRFEWLMEEKGYGSDMERYYAAQKLINDDLGLWMSGYYPFSEQKAIEIMLYKGVQDNLEKVYASLCSILHLVKPTDEEGNKRFKLFEHTCSEHGVWALYYTPAGNWKLTSCRWGREEVVKEWENLREALFYCQKHHYYESSENED